MKILVVSGFLGAGKTTFIKELAKHTRGRLAVLENEYGASGIDGDILKNGNPDNKLNIWEMTEGCICCSMKRDFAASVLTIANTVDPDYLVVEPTGVGMLSGVLQNLRQVEYERISLLAPVTIVDGFSYRRYLAEYPEIYCDQIAAAHTVLVSKLGQADASWLQGDIQKRNPEGEVFTEHYTSLGEEFWNRLFMRRYDGSFEEETPCMETLPDSYSLDGVTMDCPERLLLLAEGLVHGKFGNIFRAKGVVGAGGQVFRFDVADGRYSISGAGDARGRAVFIGTDINRQLLDACFCRPKMIRKVNKGYHIKPNAF